MNTPKSLRSKADGTVGKALEVLDSVAAYERPVKFGELLEHSDYPKATLYRLLQTLTNQNLLAHDPETGSYSLGLRLIRLAHAAWEHASLAPIARPYVEELAAAAGESVHLAQMDNGQVIFVEKLKATDRFETLAQVGKVAPAYCTGVGKAMLAFIAPKRLDIVLQQQSFFPYTSATHSSADSLLGELSAIRENGIAFDREEHEEGIVSIAAPIFISNGRVIGALSVATSTTRHDLSGLTAFKGRLLETAEKIGNQATSWHFPG
ncbi:MAG: IclR family transcriptional regulator [Pseudomonadota bacterium]